MSEKLESNEKETPTQQIPVFKQVTSTRQPDDSFITIESELQQEILQQDYEPEGESKSRFIRVTNDFRTRWDLFTMILALWNCFSVPFMAAFYDDSSIQFFLVNTLIDCIFMVDISFNFKTTYIDDNGQQVFDQKAIAKRYIKGQFFIDLISSVPLDNFLLFFGNTAEGTQVLALSDLLKLLRILRLTRIIRYTRARDDVKATMKLLQLTMYLIIWIHLTACFWFVVVSQDKDWVPVPDFITGETELWSSGIWKQYFTSFYHGVWLLTGGEVGPRTTFENFLAATLFVTGALITAVLFGEMAVLMSNLNKKQADFQELMDTAMTTMMNLNLPKDMINEILDYLTQTQSSLSAQKEYEDFRQLISPSLTQQICACIYDPIIIKNYVLSGQSRLSLLLMKKLDNKFTKPQQEIVVQGNQNCDCLYFLVEGELQVFVTDRYKQSNFITYLGQGSHFGQIGLVYNTPRTATVVSCGYCTVTQLQRKNYEKLAQLFPHFTKKFRQATSVYNDPFKNFLLDSLRQAYYFDFLPSETLSEIVYMMKPNKLEAGQYLQAPGDTITSIYILAEGELEVSFTCNQKYLHLLKLQQGVTDMEKSPIVARKKGTIEDFSLYKTDYYKLQGLKNKAEILPIYFDNRLSYITSEQTLPPKTETVGDYPQQITVTSLKQGAVLNSKIALIRKTSEIQIKAVKNCIIYQLPQQVLETLSSENSEFKSEISRIKKEMRSQQNVLSCSSLDYQSYEVSEKISTRRWKMIIVELLHKLRDQRKKGASLIGVMVSKLIAIQACEQANNRELADKVVRDEIPPHFILPNGTLDPEASIQQNSNQLPKSHPILKAFASIFQSIQIRGTLHQKFNELSDNIELQKQQIDEFQNKLNLVVDYLEEREIDDIPRPVRNLQVEEPQFWDQPEILESKTHSENVFRIEQKPLPQSPVLATALSYPQTFGFEQVVVQSIGADSEKSKSQNLLNFIRK